MSGSMSFLVWATVVFTPQQARPRSGVEFQPREPQVLLGRPDQGVPFLGALGPCADFDGDGDVDLIVDSYRYRNDGSGVFHPVERVGTAFERSLGTFDADGDSVLDFLTSRHLYLGTAGGGFLDASDRLPADYESETAVLADVDGDLDPDIVWVLRDFQAMPGVRLLLNDGSGAFTAAAVPSGPVPRRIAGADVDGDQDIDLVLASDGGGAILWRNEGNGTFTPDPAAIPASFHSSRALLLVDVDGDTDPDIVLGNMPSNPSRLLVNTGGVFVAGSLPQPPTARQTEAILPVDVDGDGDVDLAFLDSWLPSTFYPLPRASDRLLLNGGAGTFTSHFLPVTPGVSLGGLASDVDGDGDTDLVLENAGGNHVLWNDGAGGFAVASRVGAPFGVLGDLDGDGLVDSFSPFEVQLNGPPGTFSLAPGTLPGLPTSCYPPFDRVGGPSALGDVDGDGDLDAYIGTGENECGIRPSLWINDGAARFVDQSTARLPQGFQEFQGIPTAVFLLPLDADGDLEAVCVRVNDSDGSGASWCYTNDGAGVFTRKGIVGFETTAPVFGDLDGDGDLDYFEGCYRYSWNGVHLNDGNANFAHASTALPTHPRPLDAQAATAGDIDGDGDLDLYVSTTGGSVPAWFLFVNDGTAQFSDEPARLPARVAGARLVDVDLDGDVDLSGTRSTGAAVLWSNDGHGCFRNTSRRVMDRASLGPAWADLDLDGDPDAGSFRSYVRHLEALGPPRLGKLHTRVVHGPPFEPYVLRQALATARIPLGSAGWLLLDPGQFISTQSGTLGPAGVARPSSLVPLDPGLIGRTTYWQAFVGWPVHSTNLATTTVVGF